MTEKPQKMTPFTIQEFPLTNWLPFSPPQIIWQSLLSDTNGSLFNKIAMDCQKPSLPRHLMTWIRGIDGTDRKTMATVFKVTGKHNYLRCVSGVISHIHGRTQMYTMTLRALCYYKYKYLIGHISLISRQPGAWKSYYSRKPSEIIRKKWNMLLSSSFMNAAIRPYYEHLS